MIIEWQKIFIFIICSRQLSKNQGLVFVKVHAPPSVILALSKHYGARKYFKDNHIEIMKETVQDEKDLILMLRFVY